MGDEGLATESPLEVPDFDSVARLEVSLMHFHYAGVGVLIHQAVFTCKRLMFEGEGESLVGNGRRLLVGLVLAGVVADDRLGEV